jgi:hypothetical protein
MTDIIVEPLQTVTQPVVLDEPGESLEVRGRVDVAGPLPAVLTTSTLNVVQTVDFPTIVVAAGDIPPGSIRGEQTGVRVEGAQSVILNEIGIAGGFNGIDVANGGEASAAILNDGFITSDSRAVNLGGDDNTLVNDGIIVTTDNPRNGTVYGDITANELSITNNPGGVIDVGEGLNGDAISLELGPLARGEVVNEGDVIGRGEPGFVNPDNQAAAVRLYSGPDAGTDLPSTFIGDIVNGPGGVLAAENGPAVVVEDGVTLDGSVVNAGRIESPDPAGGVGIRFEAGSDLTGQIVNQAGGTIDGGRDGIDIGNGGDGSFEIVNEGLITSTSRAVNLGADDNALVNDGTIVTSDNPRNGTVYGDILADQIAIENGPGGVIDVGAGLDGDAISLELGPDVSGSVVNAGLVQGRGLPGVENPANWAAAVRLYSGPDVGTDLPSTFTGDIVNGPGGVLAAENGPAVIIEDDVTFIGRIVNEGTIEGGATASDGPSGPGTGRLAIDAGSAEGSVDVVNAGTIEGDVRLSAGDDRYEGGQGTQGTGLVDGGGGEDTLAGGDSGERFLGGDGADLLFTRAGDDTADGGGHDDRINLAEGDDSGTGGDGDDFLAGGPGSDTLEGGAGDDRIFGFDTPGNVARFFAGIEDGGDVIAGGTGNDTLTGGAGADTFVFAPGDGVDLITDFQIGQDLLDLSAFSFSGFDAVAAAGSQSGGQATFTLDGGTEFGLAGVDIGDLSQDQFLL